MSNLYCLFVIRYDVHSLEYGVLGLWGGFMGLFQHIPISNKIPGHGLIIKIDVDKTKRNIFKVTFIANSSNDGDIPTFLLCPAYGITSIKQWKSKKDH